MKKILTIIIILILVLAGVWVAYVYFGAVENGGSGPDGSITVRDFFPFGREGGEPSDSGDGFNELPERDGEGSEQPVPGTAPVPVFRNISSEPVAGFTSILTDDETLIRFVDRATGHVFETKTDSLFVEKISNTTIPKIREAQWVEDGEAFIARYLKEDGETIETFYARLGERATTTEDGISEFLRQITGTFLPAGIQELAVSPNSQKIFYIVHTPSGAVGTIADPDGDSKVRTFESPLNGWLAQWPATNLLALATKPSARAENGLYLFNTGRKRLDPLIDQETGVTGIVSPDGSLALYTIVLGRTPVNRIIDTSDGTSVFLSIATLAEKCVWGGDSETVWCAVPNTLPNEDLPDAWYQGKVSFEDTIWEIDAETGEGRRVFDPASFNRSIDAVDLQVIGDGDMLLLINKKDSGLWSLNLKPAANNPS